MQKALLFLTIFVGSVFLATSPVSANHKAKSVSSPVFTATLAKNRLSVSLNFTNLTNVKTVSYQMTYDSNKGMQGVSGTIRPKTRNLSRRLLLGTCSKNVCSYHRNVKNLKISADYTLKSGSTVSFEKNL